MRHCATGEKIEAKLGEFASTQLEEEAARQGVTVEELLVHAVLYYLADADSARIARWIPAGRCSTEVRRLGLKA